MEEYYERRGKRGKEGGCKLSFWRMVGEGHTSVREAVRRIRGA